MTQKLGIITLGQIVIKAPVPTIKLWEPLQ